MVNQPEYQSVGYIAFQFDLVPVFLVEMLGSLYASVVVSQFNGIFWVAFHACHAGTFQVDEEEHAVGYLKDEVGVIERKTFGDGFLFQAIFSDCLYIHNYGYV